MVLTLLGVSSAVAQTVYIPSGTSGISSSSTSNVGIGTSAPAEKLEVAGNLKLSSALPIIFLNGTETDAKNIALYENAGHFRIDWTSNVNMLSLQGATGNAGLGIMTPEYRLDIRTPLSIASQVHIGASSTDWGAYLTNTNDRNAYLSGGAAFNGTTWVAKAASYGILGTNNGAIHFFTGTGLTAGNTFTVTERMRIDHAGNVGIGTITPGLTLDVIGPVRSNSSGIDVRVQAGAGGGAGMGAFSDHPLLLFVNATERMRIDTAGNVGIGTSSPAHKLAVNGTIRAKEVIVDTGWVDFVFDPDYRLAPLSEVESHIREERHLPDIPSALQVAQEGISLGQMQKLLLQKIEELTLHLISQEKRLGVQQASIDRLQSENRELRVHLGVGGSTQN